MLPRLLFASAATTTTTISFRRRNPFSRLLFLSLISSSLPTACRGLASWGSSMSKSYTTERSGDDTITITPKNEADQSALVVIVHGLGDSADGFGDVAESFAQELPYVKFICPTARRQPVTLNGGMVMPSWYDIVGLDERSNENCKGIDFSKARLESILQLEHEQTGLPYSRMLLAGFSQGGALSLFTGLQLKAEQKLAGVICWSGYLPAASQFTVTPGLEDVPVFHGHGNVDMVVNYSLATKSKAAVEAKGIKEYTLKTYPIGHTVAPDELKDAMEFLRKVLPPDDTCKVTLKDPSEMSIKELKAAIRKAGLASQSVGLMEKHEFVKLLQDHRAA